MALPRGYRFDIEFDDAFPQGLVLIGEVAPDNEYQTREDKAAGRPVRQKIDEVTGRRQWKATVTDPDEPTAKRASFEITFDRRSATGSNDCGSPAGYASDPARWANSRTPGRRQW
jgi:hypothetical protein